MSEHYEPLISIITPVYNCKKYIGQCIDSILAQTYKNFELLLVDDGSSDGSGEICDQYALLDGRVLTYHKSNGGVSSARNLGLKTARGEWLIFVDADDMIKEDALWMLLNSIDKETEFLMYGYEYIKNNTISYTTSKMPSSDQCEKYNRDDGISKMFQNEYWAWFICSKMFRKDIIQLNDIMFDPNLYYGEDRLFIVNYLCSIQNNIAINSVPIYSYRIHHESAEARGYYKYSEKNLTGFIASVQIYKCMQKADTTNENRFLALNDLINSYHVQRGMIRNNGFPSNHKFKVSLNKIFNGVMSPFDYVIFVLLRKLSVRCPRLKFYMTNRWGRRYEEC